MKSPPLRGLTALFVIAFLLMTATAFASATPVPASATDWPAAVPSLLIDSQPATPMTVTGDEIVSADRTVQVAPTTTKGTGNKNAWPVAYDATTKYTKRDANSTSCEVYADRTTWSGRALATKVIDICIDTAT